METMTMADIAGVAKVSRQAVSMWRKRPTARGGAHVPFPDPVDIVAGVERFDRVGILDWLERSGRGNNRDDQSLDAPAWCAPESASFEQVVLLLSWHVLTGEDLTGTTRSSRTAVAEQFDPSDEYLLREIAELDVADEVLVFTDELVGASLGSADALSRLEAGRLGRERGLRDVTDVCRDLLRHVVDAAVTHLGADHVAIAPIGDPDLALTTAGPDRRCVITGDTDDVRAARRRALIEGIQVDSAIGSPVVTVASAVGRDPAEVLQLADEMALNLGRGDVGIMLGPADALTDQLAGSLQMARAHVLRTKSLVAAIRMPRGLWREAHRKSLALWVCVGGADTERILAADLDRFPTGQLGDLADDVAAAMAGSRARAPRFLRPIDLAPRLASGALVPRGLAAGTLHSPSSVDFTDRVHRATLQTIQPIATLDVLIGRSESRIQILHRSLGEMVRAGHLSMRLGSRINTTHVVPGGSVKLLPGVGRALDPLDVARLYPRAKRTEPGDLVIVEKPEPRAWVDEDGGSIVEAPAKLLRLTPNAGVGPHVVAAAINTMAEPGSEWKTWRIPGVGTTDVHRLEETLIRIEAYQRDLETRLAAARDLTTALIEGVAAGDISLDTTETTDGITATRTTVSAEKG